MWPFVQPMQWSFTLQHSREKRVRSRGKNAPQPRRVREVGRQRDDPDEVSSESSRSRDQIPEPDHHHQSPRLMMT